MNIKKKEDTNFQNMTLSMDTSICGCKYIEETLC